jgi:elongation factor Ts
LKPSASDIKDLREKSGAGVIDCKKALEETCGDTEKALHLLKEKSLVKVQKKAQRETRQGLVASYIHTGGRVGAIIEVNCETDFVARTDEFKQLVHNLAMQVTAACPLYVTPEEMSKIPDAEASACLLSQPFIKDPTKTVQDVINETIAKIGENVKVNRFSRFELNS